MKPPRTKGRTPPPALARMPRPPEWGPWESRPYLVSHSEAHTRGMPPWMERWAANIKGAWVNQVYSVQVFDHLSSWGVITHLLVRPHDMQPVHRWSDLQRIKDDLVGVDRVAVEVYPAAKDMVDVANIYHLWCLPAGFELPFGLHRWKWDEPA